ncbi:MAG: NADH-quinone oxidoreductase subunit A [Sphingobacteriaceae bacterium]|nr:MAG: NADH-quinone oxidoreductase subunit A [Sphingobacteriaceae bacterium]
MLLYLLMGVVVALLLYAINVIVYTPIRSNASSNLLMQTYECGFEALVNQSRLRHTISYYIVALLYVIFDLEIALILPAIVCLSSIGLYGSILLLIIMTLLCLCFIYELSLGVFEAIVRPSNLA